MGRPVPPAVPLGGFHLSWHISAGARWVPGTGPHTRGHRFGPKKSKSTVRDSQLLVRCIPLRSEQQCCCRPAVAGGHFSSVSRRAAPQVSSAWSPRALERAGGQKQACGSCAQLLLRCERLPLATQTPHTRLSSIRGCGAICKHITDRSRASVVCSPDRLSLLCRSSAFLLPNEGATWRVSSPQTSRPQPLGCTW